MLVKRVTYKEWAGISIVGQELWKISDSTSSHLTRAAWLTAYVETGAKIGTVQSYDGAGMSAGIEHKIAIYPKTLEQGSLWNLLGKLPKTSKVQKLFDALEEKGWYLDERSILRKSSNGAVVPGNEIRNEFAPPNGTVPASGINYEKAVTWARLWHEAFSDKETVDVQIQQAKKSLLLSHKDIESKVYKKYASLEDASAATTANLGFELDLAMCVYHSFSVNSPTRARKVLQEVFDKNLPKRDFCKELVESLGNNTFANWKQRYQRTAAKIKTLEMWPKEVVDFLIF